MTPKQFELIDHVLNALENPMSCEYTGQPISQVTCLLSQKLMEALHLDSGYVDWIQSRYQNALNKHILEHRALLESDNVDWIQK